MEAYKIATRIDKHGALILDKLPFQAGDQVDPRPRCAGRYPLPFQAGDQVEVIVRKLPSTHSQATKSRYPLRGKVVRYDDPFSPVAESDWEVLQNMERIFSHTVDKGVVLLGLNRAGAEAALARGRNLRGRVHCW